MPNRAPKRESAKARTPEQVRRLFRDAFVHCMDATGATSGAAARWLKRRPSTIRGWLAGTHRIDLEAVACSPKLWPHFLRCVVGLERKTRHV